MKRIFTLYVFLTVFFVGSLYSQEPPKVPWVLIVHVKTTEELESLASRVVSRPALHLVLDLPGSFFRPSLMASHPSPVLKQAVEKGSLEVALSLPGEPILPLILDSDIAKHSPTPPRFSWPEDIRIQVAEAIGRYQRYFGRSPQGLVLPGGVYSKGALAELERFKFDWVLAASSSSWTWFRVGALAVVRPRRGSFAEVDLAQPQVFAVEASTWSSLDDFLVQHSSIQPLGLSEWMQMVPPSSFAASEPEDYSSWIGAPDQNAAWDALEKAREAVRNYQDSGRAELSRLDAALHEVRALESREYFEGNKDSRREFVATLSTIYRLIGMSPPGELGRLFSGLESQVPGQTAAHFSSGPDWLRWTDEVGDDHGPGYYVYPSTGYPSGSWDIKDFEVRWDTTSVRMSFGFVSLSSNPWSAPAGFSLPAVDVYIDLNHMLGAGAEVLLPGRGARLAPEDGWEYALCVTGWGAFLYRSNSGLEFSKMGIWTVSVSTETGRFSVELPRSLLRGNPMNWGYAVGVSPKGRSKPSDPFDLMPIRMDAGPEAFGGVRAGTSPSSFVDIIVPEGKSQEEVLSAYESGRPVILPMLRAQ